MQDRAKNHLLKIFEALSNPIRLDIFLNVYEAQLRGDSINLLQATRQHKLVRSSISHHVKSLEQAGLITRDKKGKEVFLTIKPHALQILQKFLDEHQTF